MAFFAKNTVRNRKVSPLLSTQRFLPVAEIHNNTILLKNGGLRAILKVEAVNFNLKSETEQQGIIAGYGAFVNTITFPLQIVIRSTRTNIDEYLKQMKEFSDKQTNELLKEQTVGYTNFMQQLIEVADIMQKRFYVIVPIDHTERSKGFTERFFDWMHPDDSLGKASQRNREFGPLVKQLNERVELVASGLGNVGLHTDRMSTRDLIEILYQVYNPKTSQNEKIPSDTDLLNLDKSTL